MNKSDKLQHIKEVFEGDNGMYRYYDDVEELKYALMLIDELRDIVNEEISQLIYLKEQS